MADRYLSAGLTVILLVVVVIMMVMAVDFNEQARRIPLAVGIPTAVALGVQLIREFLGLKVSPDLADSVADDEVVAPPDGEDGVPVASSAVEQATTKTRTERAEIDEPKVTAPVAFGWIAALTLMFWLLGLMFTVPLFIGLFMRKYGRESWKLIAAVVVGMLATLHLLFVVFLEMRLYSGVLAEWLDL